MKTTNITAVLAFTFLLLAFSACKKEDSTLPTNQFYTIQGVVKSPNLNKPIGNALVYADSKSSSYQTRTDAQGKYTLRVPLGPHTIFIESGNGTIFNNSFTVNSSVENEQKSIPENQSILTLKGKLAYIAGSYDQIEAVVRDTLGYTITQLQSSDLENAALLSTFDAIFINCGATELSIAPSDSGFINLGNFVSQGGSIYASDFAMDFLKGVSDGTCAPAGGFIDDSKICTSRTGIVTTLSGCQVLDPGLQTALGTNTINITYDLGGWEVATQVDNTFWTTDINEATYGALLLHTDQYTNGSGNTPGKIYWTTFHNEYNSTISNTSESILEYVIVHL